MIAQHSSATNEHYTPASVTEPARALLGAFDLDPASCPEANERIRATRFFTQADDGLSQAWSGRVWLNPPGGKLKKVGGAWVPVAKGPGESSMRVWWDRLAGCWACNEIESAFFVGFTLEILRTSQSCVLPVHAFPRCYPRERLPFRGDQPTHANVLVYLPPKVITPQEATDRLHEAFGQIGLCEGPALRASAVLLAAPSLQVDARQGALL